MEFLKKVSLVVLQSPHEVPLGVVEVKPRPYRGNVELGHGDGATGGLYRSNDGIDLLNSDRALEAGHSSSIYGLTPLV
jgi:hypothetical protein